MKKIFLPLFFLPLFALGQDFMIQNQWWLQMPLFNPAASGTESRLDAATGIRFGGYTDYSSGSFLYGRVDGYLEALNSGFGISYFNQNPEYLGGSDDNYLMRQRFAFNYNYQFRFENTHILSLGVTAEMIRNAWSLDWLPTNPSDPTMPAASGVGNDYTLGFGVLYQAKNWHVGASLVPGTTLQDNVNLTSPEEAFYLSASGKHFFNDALGIEGAALFAYSFDDYGLFNANLRVWFFETIYAGFGLNYTSYSSDSFDMLLGLQIFDKLSIHYAYVFVLSDFSNANPNQNVIGLMYQLTD